MNVCTGNSIGVRASQAGDAFDRPMFTSFGVQWFDKARGAWLPVPGAASPWQAAGPGPWLARESGWTQTFVPQPGGARTLLRGVVQMQWRSAGGAPATSQTLITPQTCTLR